MSDGKIVKPKLHELQRSIDRVSFVYLDQTSINVDGGSIVAFGGKTFVLSYPRPLSSA